MDTSAQESLLVARAQAGDSGAFEDLFLAVHKPLLRYVSGLVGCEHAEDVLQETFLQIHRKIRWLQEPLAFRAWSYRIATRLSFAHLKRERRWSEQIRDEELLHNLPDVEITTSDFEIEEIGRLMEHVSPKSRAVLLMRYREELSLDAIALILDIPLGTAKSRLAYGLSSLRLLANNKEQSHDYPGKR
jgi:RNA polymerase sigma-70 factor (ECF subfamily)